MCGAPRIVVIAPWISARLDGPEAVEAAGIRQHPAPTGEVRIEWRVVVVDVMRVAARCVCLPHLDQRMRNRPAVLVENPTGNDDPLAERRRGMPRSEVAV